MTRGEELEILADQEFSAEIMDEVEACYGERDPELLLIEVLAMGY